MWCKRANKDLGKGEFTFQLKEFAILVAVQVSVVACDVCSRCRSKPHEVDDAPFPTKVATTPTWLAQVELSCQVNFCFGH